MSNHRHIIHKQYIQLDFGQMHEETAIPNRIAEVFYRQIQPKMERLFDEFFSKDDFVSFPVVHIDCGTFPTENWEEVWVKNTIYHLRNELRTLAIDKVNNKQRRHEQAKEEFLFFLQHGRFRWGIWEGRLADIEKEITIDQACVDRITALVYPSGHAFNRLLQSCSSSFIKKLVGQTIRQLDSVTSKFIAVLSKQIDHERLNAAVLMAHAIISGHFKKKNTSFAAILTSVVWSNSYAIAKHKLTASMLKFVKGTSEGIALLNGDEEWRKTILSILLDKQGVKTNELYKMVYETQQRAEIRTKGSKNNEAKVPGRRAKKMEKLIAEMLTNQQTDKGVMDSPREEEVWQPEMVETIYIENAGLVILHPFLEQLFEIAGLIRNPKTVAQDFYQTAPVLLQYVLQGNTEIEEFQLPLNKVLCGLTPEAFVECAIELPERIASECDELLHSVIGHWVVLKNTSVEGLRETFLQRPGKLTKVDGGWGLTVESRGADILLASLPWGISTIKLPWMDEILFVEWLK